MKSLHLLVEKHMYQSLILASLILVACHENSVSRVSTIQLNLNTDFESNFISVTNFILICLLPIVAYKIESDFKYLFPNSNSFWIE
jgi:membrane-bound metal-dependent hydrolase YbcI (DUF457 family)